MAKLKYDSTLVNSTIDELGDASNQLINVEDEMRSALTIIANARGISYVDTDTLFNTLGFPSACQEMIEETITSIKNRASEIEEYNEEYENASFLEKLGSTAGLFLTKICEGIGSAGEQIVDGFASIIGLGAGLISKDAQNSIANFIEKDHVGDFFGNLYDTSLKSMVIKSWASESGLACNIFKGIGTGIGYAAALAATGAIAGGISTGTVAGAKAGATFLMTSLPASATVAGVAGIGAGTQAGLKGGWDYSDAFCYGLKYGAIQAGTTIVFTYAFKALSKGWNMLKTKMKGTATNSTSLTVIDDAATGGSAGTAGGATGSTTATAAKSGVTFTEYNGYTCLDDVWDDVIAGKLDKKQVADIIKNTVGLDDGGLGHNFMSDTINFLKGSRTAAEVPQWKIFAEQMLKNSGDETIASAAGNVTTSTSGGTVGSSTAGTTIDETFTSATQDLIESTTGSGTSTAQELIESTTGTGTNATQELIESTSGAGVDEVASGVTKQDLSAIKRSMDSMGERLAQRQDTLTLAQQNLDDAIAQGADETTLATLRKELTTAQTAYDKQYQSLLSKQQQYIEATSSGQFDAIGTEKYKLINGELIADENSIAGNITTLRTGTTTSSGNVEYRPNWTNASAKVEGQIDGKALSQAPSVTVAPTPAAEITALATVGPTGLATLAPQGTTALATVAPQGSTIIATIPPTGTTALATIAPEGPTALATTGPTALVPTATPGPIATVTIAPSIVPTPTITIVPTPTIVPASGDTVIFGVVEPKEVVTPVAVTITPNPVDPIVTTPPPVVTTPPPVVTTPPPVVTTTPPVVTTPPQYRVTSAPVVTTAPPVVVTTAPPIVTTAPPIVTTAPPIDAEYVPIPNTGVGTTSSTRIGVAPIVAGAVTGIAGIVGGALLKGKDKKSEDEDVEELEYESEE